MTERVFVSLIQAVKASQAGLVMGSAVGFDCIMSEFMALEIILVLSES